MTALPTTPSFMDYEAVYLPKNHFIKAESMETEDYLALFYPFDQLDLVKKGIESSWSVSGDRTMVALTMTFADEPMAKTMSFQREYAEAYDWVAQQFKDWAFTLITSILYYNDYDLIDEDTRTCTARVWRPSAALRLPIILNYCISRLSIGTSIRCCWASR